MKEKEFEPYDIENVVWKIEELREKIPERYLIFLSVKCHLAIPYIIGGVRIGGLVHVSPGNYDEADISKLRVALRTLGIDMSVVYVPEDRDGKGNYHIYAYNPEKLEEATRDTKFAPPYKKGQDYHEYFTQAVRDGYDYRGLLGVFFSYPDSAIEDFIFLSDTPWGRILKKYRLRFEGGSYIEAMGILYLRPTRELKKRLGRLKRFADCLMQNKRYQKIIDPNSDGKIRSDWGRRVFSS